MRRREFLGVLSGAATAWPLAARAQQPMPMIGFLHVATPGPFEHLVAAFKQGLAEVGFVDGQSVRIEYRWAEGRYERLPAMATDLVRSGVVVIATFGGEPAAFAGKGASTTIPVVFNIGSDPVQMGLVKSLSRPEANVTGFNIFSVELVTKRLGLLHDLISAPAVIAMLINPTFPPSEANVKEAEVAARALGRELRVLRASSDLEIDAAFAALALTRPGALLVGIDPFFTSRRHQFATNAARLALPTMYEQREFAQAGGLMSYGTSLADAYRQQGVYVGRLLKGTKPGDLPILQATKFELVINLNAARALGLTIPAGLLAAADEVIE
jgi:putative tryptophan/tyrosine transport system substrate-binding protein